MPVTATLRIQQADFDVAQEIAALSTGRTDVGAVVTFSGLCRGSENGEPGGKTARRRKSSRD